jgi:hypothetical protein
MSRSLRFAALLFFLVVAGASTASAQLRVDLKIARRLFIVHEPIIASVQITNLAGRDVTLRDKDGQQWFGFQIMTPDERPIPPLNPNYSLEPMTVPEGKTVKRSVNLADLYQLSDFGLYRVKATVYFADLDRFFTSAQDNIELTEGKLIWQQTVGVPEGTEGAGTYRTLSILTHRLLRDNQLYIRVQDRNAGITYCTHKVARLLSGFEPEIELDEGNRLHVLQLVGPRTYVYTRVGLNGEWLGQQVISETKTRPNLRKLASGAVEVRGGAVQVAPAQSAGPLAPVPAKLSDRPPGLPPR